MNSFSAVILIVVAIITQATRLDAEEINPDTLPDPLNKVFFAVRIYPDNGPVRSMQIEVDTVKECIEHLAKVLAQPVGEAKAIEGRCIKERNAEKAL